jgi:hypothetical protein
MLLFTTSINIDTSAAVRRIKLNIKIIKLNFSPRLASRFVFVTRFGLPRKAALPG